MCRRIRLSASVGALVLSCAAASADSVTLHFEAVSNNAAESVSIGETQFSVSICDAGMMGGLAQVLFEFMNSGPDASSMTDIYFDDDSMLGSMSIDNSDPGVSFSENASPSNLPGGSAAGFFADHSLDSDSPVSHRGINPGEWLGVTFTLQAGMSYSDLVDDLASGALRIGVRGQAFDNGESEAYINTTSGMLVPPAVPLPSPALLAGLGLAGVIGANRRRAV